LRPIRRDGGVGDQPDQAQRNVEMEKSNCHEEN